MEQLIEVVLDRAKTLVNWLLPRQNDWITKEARLEP
jgi:hypothetical protein